MGKCNNIYFWGIGTGPLVPECCNDRGAGWQVVVVVPFVFHFRRAAGPRLPPIFILVHDVPRIQLARPSPSPLPRPAGNPLSPEPGGVGLNCVL